MGVGILSIGLVTFYENFTNKYGGVDRLGVVVSPPGYLGYLWYNFLIAWAIRTIYTSRYVQINPSSCLKRQMFYYICNILFHMQKVRYAKTVGGGYHTSLAGLRVKM